MSAGTWSSDSVAARSARASDVPLPLLVLKALGSLKITVVMFGLGILLLLFGTLAQDQQNLAEVKRLYFNAWLAVVPIDVLFPVTIIPHELPFPGAFPFPGGATIGLILMVNLMAAKATRFSMQAKGMKLAMGIVVSLLGGGIVTTVIISGHAADGLQGAPPVSYDTLWMLLRGGCLLMSIAAVGYCFLQGDAPRLVRILTWICTGLLIALTLGLVGGGNSLRLNDPGLRIVWQLLQAGIASFVCLIGLMMIFGKRGGNVLIHAGIGLMMVGQFVFGDRQVEQRLSVAEGQSTSLVFRQDELELAVIDTSDPEQDKVTAIPEARLRRAIANNQMIDAEELPMRFKILRWFPNSTVVSAASGTNEATLGQIGSELIAKGVEVRGGAMEGSNIASAYVQVFPKSGGEALGTVLLTQYTNDQAQLFLGRGGDRNERVTVDGKEYELALRFRREYKPYQVTLKDVSRINYGGTETPRDYSSTILITDKDSGAVQEGRTWMNNPIRYRGETFYQSQYNLDRASNTEITGLQVVENSGWVIPYVTCMMVMVGMLAHFGGTFLTFAGRYDRGLVTGKTPANLPESAAQTAEQKSAHTDGKVVVAASSPRGRWLPAVMGIGAVLFVAGYFAKPERSGRSLTDWPAIAKLPVQHEGRIKPLDTVAKNVLQVISEPIFGSTPYVTDASDEKHSPTEWLMGIMAEQEWALSAPVFRIYAQEVRDIFELKPRKGYRYSYNELLPNRDKFSERLQPLRAKDSEQFDAVEQKLVAMHNKLQLFDLVSLSYRLPNLPDGNKAMESEDERQKFTAQLMSTLDAVQRIEAGHPPAMIPPAESNSKDSQSEQWQAFGPAFFAAYVQNLMSPERIEPNPALLAFTDVMDGIRKGSAVDTNKAVAAYHKTLEKLPAAAVHLNKASTEAWLNKFSPTSQAILFYLVAIVMAFVSLMTGSVSVRRATFWMLVATFVIHTLAIVSRIYISGRPPVINLYSSAVFIGWATAVVGLLLELIFPIGVCNLAVAMLGVITLSVARSLDNNDTMHVLQAVLDTQFWLSTHVVTVTYGYAATYLAGILGIFALVHRMAKGSTLTGESKRFQDLLYRMNYGVVCFGLFLSFIGTVLGGLWADDSWGRFWGWDPKENGALMIVLWNAIVLHSRWDKQVGQRGFALLTVVGNIITTWSWFGVNQLGVGLHSYGNNSSVLAALLATVVAHMIFIVTAFVVTSLRAREA